ncbi:MAG: tetratricopeptide repeat protein, partial [Proteobacteria bacterium]|nr:tetratricopeptide repeat protein [Pseudomonadota bacterium]
MRPASLGSIALALALSLAGVAGCGSVEGRLTEARALQDAGDFSSSVSPLRQVLAKDPNQPEANYLLGVALVQTHQSSLAIWPLRKASESEDYAVQAGLLLASSLLETDAYEDAITATNGVLAVDPDRFTALRIRSQASLESGRPESALADAERMMELEPDNFVGMATRAESLIKLKRMEEAEAAHREIYELTVASGDPSMASRGCQALAGFYAEHEPEAAEPVVEECLAAHPGDQQIMALAAEYFDSQEQPERGTALLREAIEREPDDLALRFNLADRLVRLEDEAGAKAVLVDAAAVFDQPPAWDRLALFYQRRGDHEAAREANLKALQGQGGGTPQMRFRQAELALDTGNLEEARRLASELTEPAYREFIEARVELEEGRYQAALEGFESGLVRWPNNSPARYLAGQAAEQLGQYEKAMAHFREAIRSDETATDAALAAARLQFSLGNYNDAQLLAQRHINKRPYAGPDAHVIAARGLAKLGRHEAALRAMVQLGEKDPESKLTVATESAAIVRAKLGPEEAATFVETFGLDLTDPANELALRSVVEDRLLLGQTARALARVDAALAAHADAPSLHDVRGRILLRTGDPA